MRWILLIPALMFITLCTGCLSFDTYETTIEFQGDNEPIKVTLVYRDISSDAKDDEELKKDFDSMINDWTGDNHLIEQMEEGFYVKDRAVKLEDGKINAYESGIIRNLEDINCYWYHGTDLVIAGSRVPPDTRIVMNLDDDDDDELKIIDTNGTVIGTGENKKIIWTGAPKKLRVVMQVVERDEASEKNRSKLIGMLKQYLEAQKNKSD